MCTFVNKVNKHKICKETSTVIDVYAFPKLHVNPEKKKQVLKKRIKTVRVTLRILDFLMF